MNMSAEKHTGIDSSKKRAHRKVSSAEDTQGSVSLRSRFHDVQRMTSELIIPYMTMSIDLLDSEMRTSIQRIVRLLGLDRGFLSQYSGHRERMVCTHSYETSSGLTARKSKEISVPPLVVEKIRRQECVIISRVADLPEEANNAGEYFRSVGTHSHLSLPLVIDGDVVGCLSLESTGAEVIWPVEALSTLTPIAAAFALSVQRKRKKLEYMERMQFESLLADLSAGFVSSEPAEVDREIISALERIGDFFGCDRCGMLSVSPERSEVRVTHAWYAEGIATVSNEVNLVPMFPWAYEKLVTHGQAIFASSLEGLPPEAEKDRQAWLAMGVSSFLNIPLFTGSVVTNIFAIQNMDRERLWDGLIKRLRLLSEVMVNALTRKESHERLIRSRDEIQSLKEKLQAEAEFLRTEVRSCHTREEIIGRSEALSYVLKQAAQVAPTDTTVLICGETGTGKELVAQAIHDMSLYRDKMMVKVNCASLPATLVESELFGREKGAYTGALTRQIGRFEMADGSTILLDEIAELPLELQAKLLRVLQEHTFERLGSPRTIKVHVRVIAATNRNILEAVKKGTFREDLFYRLNVFPITVPPLRERVEDIPMLVWAFVTEFCEKMGKRVSKIAKRDMEALQKYSWPGNIRELRNVIEHAVIVSPGDALELNLPQDSGKGISWAQTLEEVECRHIMDVLRHTGGRIKGEGGAAKILGMFPSTLTSRMKKLGIRLRNEKGEISS